MTVMSGEAASEEYILFGMGNPLLDLLVECKDDALHKKHDLKENDAILAEEKHRPLYTELVSKHAVEYIAGGATQNVLRGAQHVLPPRSTVYVGCVGDDDFAAKQKEAAEADGLRVEYLVDKDHPTGTCAVLCYNEQRSLVANLSAAEHYKILHLESREIWQLVERAKYYYISGFFLTVSLPSILKVAEHGASNNKVFCMNLSAPFLCQFFKDPMMQASKYWDIIFGNEGEAEAYATAHNVGSTDIKIIAKHLYDLPKVNKSRNRLVVLTQGPHPTIVCQDGKVAEFPTPQISHSEIVDTNGAGDAFCGGFMAHYIRGESVQACVAAGQFLAGIVIRQSGCKYPKGLRA